MVMTTSRWSVGRTATLLLLAAIAGALAGAAASFIVTPIKIGPIGPIGPTPPAITVPTSTVAEPSLVPIAPRLSSPLVPPSFVSRRASPVATVYRKAKGATADERSLTDDRMLGQAVALTSDGWFVTTLGVLNALRTSDLTIWHGERSYAVERGNLDHLNNTVYLKVRAIDLTAPAFGRIEDLVPGAVAWFERRATVISPTIVTSLTDRMPSTEPVSSEVAARRIRLDGTTDARDAGAAVWDDRGGLLGIVESAPGEALRIIPASSISVSFASLINVGEIRHAMLGVRAVDLVAWRIDGDRGDLPSRGSLVKSVSKDSPAALAGLKTGDVILRIERDTIDGRTDLGEILSDYRPDATLSLQIVRNGEEREIVVALRSVVTSDALK